MSRIIAYMITHEQGIRVTMALCMLAGFIVGASFLNVRRGMRRVIFYVWLTVVVVLSLVTFMTLWVLLAAAAQDGYASVLCAAALAIARQNAEAGAGGTDSADSKTVEAAEAAAPVVVAAPPAEAGTD